MNKLVSQAKSRPLRGLLLAAISSVLVVTACRQFDEELSPGDGPGMTLAKAKAFVEEQGKASRSKGARVTEGKLVWELADNFTITGGGNIVGVPIGNLKTKDGFVKQLFTEYDGEVHSILLVVVPEKEYLERTNHRPENETFTGDVYSFSATAKRMITGWRYQDGKIVATLTPKKEFESSKVARNSEDPDYGVTLPTVTVYSNSNGWQSIPAHQLWNHIPSYTDGSGQIVSGTGSTGYGGGTGSGTSYPVLIETAGIFIDISGIPGITIDLTGVELNIDLTKLKIKSVNDTAITNPCIRATYNLLNSSKVSSNAISTFFEIFHESSTGQFRQIRLIFKESTEIEGDGETRESIHGANEQGENYPVEIIISLNPNQLAHASQERVFLAIVHEMVHAILLSEGIPNEPQVQHAAMYRNWFGSLTGALRTAFPNLSERNAEGLVLAGFGQLEQVDPNLFNALLSENGFTRDEVASIGADYSKTGYRGTRPAACR